MINHAQHPSNQDLTPIQGAYASNEYIEQFIISATPHSPKKLFPGISHLMIREMCHRTSGNLCDREDRYGSQPAAKLVVSPEKSGTSYLQQILKIGCNRAAGYMALLRERGVVKNRANFEYCY